MLDSFAVTEIAKVLTPSEQVILCWRPMHILQIKFLRFLIHFLEHSSCLPEGINICIDVGKRPHIEIKSGCLNDLVYLLANSKVNSLGLSFSQMVLREIITFLHINYECAKICMSE